MQMWQEFQNYANSLNTGYLKSWKAGSILVTLKAIPAITQDEERFLHYIENCLTMEGFTDKNCEAIAKWLHNRL